MSDGDRPEKKKVARGASVRAVNRPLPSVVEPPAAEDSEATQNRAQARGRKLLAAHQLKLVWLQLRGTWSWLVVVPAEPGLSTSDFAHALSQVGSRLSAEPVDFIEATNVDLDSGSWLIDRLGSSAEAPESWRSDPPLAAADAKDQSARTIVALENPIANPFALPVALAADGVIVCVRRGRSRLASIRKIIEAVGAEHVLCSVLVD